MASKPDDGSQRWIDAALAELARGGVEGVRVEVVAQRLGVTKGGFYRRFRDRPHLLQAVLDQWAQGRIEAIVRHTELDGLKPAERLRAVIELYSERINAQGIAIELAIRQWARSDQRAAEAAAKVDAVRLERVSRLYAMMGLPAEEVRTRAVLFYTFIFGRSLLYLEMPATDQAGLAAACAEMLTLPG